MMTHYNEGIVISLILFLVTPAAAYTVGNEGISWAGNSTMDNVTEDSGDSLVKVGVFADNFNDGNYNGWIVYSKPTTNASDGIWSASNGYLKVSGGTTPRWHSIKYNTPLQQNISLMYDFNIIGTQEYAAQFWDIDSGKLWFNFLDINDPADTNYHLRYEIGSETQVIENLGITPDVSNNIAYGYKTQIFGGQYKFYLDNVLKNISSGNTRNTPNKIGVGTYLLNANDEVRWDNIRALAVDSNGNEIISGNLTAWYDSGTGNEIYRLNVNATTPANTNYTVLYRQNGTGNFAQVGTVYTGNNTIALNPGYRNTDVRVVLNGNQIATPELISITFYAQPVATP